MQSLEASADLKTTEQRLLRTLRYAGSLLALLSVFAGGSIIAANQPIVLALQRSLVSLSVGGGATPIPHATQLLPVFGLVIAYTLLFFCATLALCVYAGRIAMIVTGDRRAGTRAGRQTALFVSTAWVVISLLAAALFHVDGSLAWVLATIVLVLASPANTIPQVYVTAPGAGFLAVQLGILVLGQGLALLITFGAGALAGRIGAGSVARRYAALPSPAAMPMGAPMLPYGWQPYPYSQQPYAGYGPAGYAPNGYPATPGAAQQPTASPYPAYPPYYAYPPQPTYPGGQPPYPPAPPYGSYGWPGHPTEQAPVAPPAIQPPAEPDAN